MKMSVLKIYHLRNKKQCTKVIVVQAQHFKVLNCNLLFTKSAVHSTGKGCDWNQLLYKEKKNQNEQLSLTKSLW